MASGSLHTDPLSGSAMEGIEVDLCVVHRGHSSSSPSSSFIPRGEATAAISLDVQVLALKRARYCLEGYEKGQMGHAMSEMRETLISSLFTAKLNRTALGSG